MPRAPKVTVKVSDGFINRLKEIDKNALDERVSAEANNTVLKKILALIGSGRSPVEGYGRFEDYKNPDKYPGTRKSARPVNLRLTGDMLDELEFRSVSGNLVYGIHSDADNDIKIRANVHNNGERDDIPQRKFVPSADEGFTSSVALELRNLIKRQILNRIKG